VLIGVGADRGGDQGCGAETSTVCCWFHPFPRGDIFISLDEFNPPLGAFPGSGGGGATPTKFINKQIDKLIKQ
jgi:hypothetical protein